MDLNDYIKEHMIQKKEFAERLTTGDNNGLGMSDCDKYGMTYGCDEECPVLNGGNCEIYSSVEDLKGDKE
ncbi:TPA: hypothetical protein I9Z35_000470 [Clostridium perfringens]|nr:hypothetical protein [Clostridium perfringens]HAT4106010.1 hypothetical protein [Clostridium perfringens]